MRTSMLSVAALSALALGTTACDNGDDDEAQTQSFERVDLVSDRDGLAQHVDPSLVNPWGLAFGPDTFFWIANNGTSTSTLYDGEGALQSGAVGGPVAMPIDDMEEGVTGAVFNGGDAFQITSGAMTAPSRFVFATAGGALIGWSPDVDPRKGVIAVDGAMTGAAYTGLAILESGLGTMLYAADFANRQVDVYDEGFAPATGLAANAFVDPGMPQGYSPFGIQAVDGRIYVAYALQSEDEPDEEEAGAGNGYVSVFGANGAFVARVASNGFLNAPWGITRAPSQFGPFGNAILIGNFGDGHITAIDAQTYQVLGQLESAPGTPIAIDGLWALSFGNDRMAGEADDLYFTAGPEEETHGIFGELHVFE
jgi:uncharacterized protein (TIGR03118 family)